MCLARENAKLKQIIRMGRCEHPFHAIVLEKQYYIAHRPKGLSILDNGFIEYCSDCDKILTVFTPEGPRNV